MQGLTIAKAVINVEETKIDVSYGIEGTPLDLNGKFISDYRKMSDLKNVVEMNLASKRIGLNISPVTGNFGINVSQIRSVASIKGF